MANLQPLHALNLDSLQQQNFIKFYNTLPEKPSTSVRIFDRNDYYSTHGEDAVTAAREIFNTTANIKQMGVEPNRLQYLVLSKGNFETFVRKLLLVRRYRVEIYTAEGSVKNNDWSIKYKGSPGNLTQMEEVLESGVGEATTETPSSLLAVNVRTDPVTKCRLVGVACVSIADYQFTVTEIADDDFLTELEAATVQLAPSECIIPQSDAAEYKTLKKIMERSNVTVTACKKSEYLTEGMIQDLNRLLKFSESQQQDANAFEETRKEVAMASLMAAIKYLELLSDQTNFGRYKLSLIQTDCFLHIDSSALCALNVFPAPGDTANAPSRHLFGLLDRCRTAHGKRLLAQWLRQPLRDINLINERLDIVEAFVNCPEVRQQLYEDHLKRIPDLQMLARRLTRKKANLQDCYRIYQAISRLSPLLKCLARTESSTVHSALAEPIAELSQDLEKYNEMVEATIDLEAVDRGDFLVKPSFDEQLEELAQVLARLQASADKLLSKAAKDLGLEAGKSIKLENNPQGGFHFRVTLKEEQALRGNKRYTIIDAVKGGVRFKIGELDSISDDYVQAKTTYGKEQNKVVAEIVNIAAGYSDCLYCLSHILSRLDVLMSFSLVAVSAPAPYCRPELVHSLDELVLEEARHPCVEVQDGVSFIANDVRFKRGESLLHIVTGANMGGKSTWMRSAGACVLLAHAGCYVPCSRAIVPRLRSLCSRVGATDREVAGHSTFMVEMVETAAILRIATPDSLVLIDELGRGTSTYEGCGIAWAIAEQLATQTQCFCLFATHYHELTRLPTVAPGRAVNSHAQASVVDDQLLLLHRIMPGPALKSLGLHVARLADLPESIVKFAEAKQAQLETNLFEMDSAAQSSEASDGHRLVEKFLKDCEALDVENLSDDELNDAVDKLKSKLDGCGNRYVEMLMAV